jgi:hypothetical protein
LGGGRGCLQHRVEALPLLLKAADLGLRPGELGPGVTEGGLQLCDPVSLTAAEGRHPFSTTLRHTSPQVRGLR